MLGWELPPHNSGGLGVACYFLSKSLADAGVSIDFIVPYSAKHDNIDYMNIINATTLNPLHKFGMGAYDSIFSYVKLPSFCTEEGANIRTIQRRYVEFVDNYLENNRPDIVHAHDWLTMEAGILAKKKYGLPFVVHIHATEFDRAGGNSGNPVVTQIEKEGLEIADKILAVSQTTKDIIVNNYGISPDKIEVVYNGFDPDTYNAGYDSSTSTQTFRYLQILKDNGYTIVSSTGRLTIQKGLSFLLKAAKQVVDKYRKVIFVIASDGEQKEELVRLSAEYGISGNVVFPGFLRGSQLRDLYNMSDIFVMSSVSEPFGLTALEAAHHNTALIITKQSGVGEILGSIFRYDYWDTNKLADQIFGIATSPSLKDSLARNVKKEYAKISWDDVAEKCVNAYNGLTNKGGS